MRSRASQTNFNLPVRRETARAMTAHVIFAALFRSLSSNLFPHSVALPPLSLSLSLHRSCTHTTEIPTHLRRKNHVAPDPSQFFSILSLFVSVFHSHSLSISFFVLSLFFHLSFPPSLFPVHANTPHKHQPTCNERNHMSAASTNCFLCSFSHTCFFTIPFACKQEEGTPGVSTHTEDACEELEDHAHVCTNMY